MDNAVQHLSQLRAHFAPATVVFFLSLNEAITDVQHLNTFCNKMQIDISSCVAVLPHHFPPIINTFPRHPLNPMGIPERAWSMYRHNENAFLMMEAYEQRNSLVFDTVIKYRVDITSSVPLDIPAPFDISAIYVPEGSDHTGLNDQVAFGSRSMMKIYCACSSNILKLCQEGCIFHPETLLLRHLQTQQAKVLRFRYPYEFAR